MANAHFISRGAIQVIHGRLVHHSMYRELKNVQQALARKFEDLRLAHSIPCRVREIQRTRKLPGKDVWRLRRDLQLGRVNK